MKIVPKPEGWDMRHKRAEQANDAKLWEPTDILFDAYQLMQKNPPAVSAVVCWYTRNPESGNLVLKFTCAQEHDRQIVALAADFLSEISAGASKL